jgi:hypothetical protein
VKPPQRSAARRLGSACLLAAVVLGCGYSSGLRVSDRHVSVGLEFLGNDSYERDLERPFDDEMSRALRNFSDAPIVDVAKADVVVRGKIKSYIHRAGIRSRENVPLETGVSIEIEASLHQKSSGKLLRGPFKITSAVGYLVGDPGNEPQARDRALRHIAEELVLDLFTPDG